jgi:hypothetical protein
MVEPRIAPGFKIKAVRLPALLASLRDYRRERRCSWPSPIVHLPGRISPQGVEAEAAVFGVMR